VDYISAAGELGVGEDPPTVEGIGILADVGFLVVELDLPHLVHELGLVLLLLHSVGSLGEVLSEVRVAVLLGAPDQGALLGGHFEDLGAV